jgi:hypothetical protein
LEGDRKKKVQKETTTGGSKIKTRLGATPLSNQAKGFELNIEH